jgi:hypothetical protein
MYEVVEHLWSDTARRAAEIKENDVKRHAAARSLAKKCLAARPNGLTPADSAAQQTHDLFFQD